LLPAEIGYSRVVSNINYTLCDATRNELLAEREFKCATSPFALPHKSRILLFETQTALANKPLKVKSGGFFYCQKEKLFALLTALIFK
jgi:hypothetical protein